MNELNNGENYWIRGGTMEKVEQVDLKQIKSAIDNKKETKKTYGKVKKISEFMIVSKGPSVKIGQLCEVGEKRIMCEVVGIKGTNVELMPMEKDAEIMIDDKVFIKNETVKIPKIHKMLGRIINGMGEFIDGGIEQEKTIELKYKNKAPNSMQRERIVRPMVTKVKAIDSLLTIGEGQRIGIFAGSGVGKTTLLSMIAENAEADVNVIALIGERGREVKEFIEENLGEQGMKKSVIIVSTSDEHKLMNIKAAELATSVAEYFRDQGKSVILMMDSITRYAMAKREIDLATGSLAPNGKTPTMESSMQALLERSGNNENGSITGIYTVLVEGDDMDGTIPDMVRGILDGHIVLDRKLANRNHFPAINVLASKSRVMDYVVTEEHMLKARETNKYLSLYEDNEDMFLYGAYEIGRDKEIDFAKHIYPKINEFLIQKKDEPVEFEESIENMKELMA